eukprot:TRINITY_DN269_c0_g1_i2.p1 TRINITY_DN269_c0_g1~~TRINITY_DN269_c0_g1_i2.p1  ORF type:complete len:1054 (+),score=335.62 TRINITY_DN269_c0_g1_i2:9680-12841(+)
MRITGIEIERFGVWEDFKQPLHRSGLTVFYGPNEAGKTTLLRFIRGVLYGFPAEDVPNPKKRNRREPQSGLLRVEHRGRAYEIRRTAYGDDAGLLSVEGIAAGDSTAAFMEDLLSSTDEKLFESVFAVGLPELQQFATLTADQVAEHLYGMTLGPQGRLLMELPNRIEKEFQRLVTAEQPKAVLPALVKRHEELSRQLTGTTRQRDRYRELHRKKLELDDRIAKRRERQAQLQANLRGLSFMERVHPPWHRCRECTHELNSLPDFSAFPSDGVQRLERLDHDITVAVKARETLARDMSGVNEQLSRIHVNPEIRRFSGAVQMLSEQRVLTKDYEARIADLERRAGAQEKELVDHLAGLGRNWSLQRLDAVQDSPEARAQFVAAQREYQDIVARTRRAQRRYKRANANCRDQELALQTELQSHGIGSDNLDSSVEVAEQRLTQLADLSRWHAEAAELLHRTTTLDKQLERLHDRPGLPDWIYGILSWFTLAGAALFIAGLYAAVTTGWIVGLIFIILSVFSAGTAIAFRTHHEQDIQQQVGELREQRLANEVERHALLDQISTYVAKSGLREWFGVDFTLDDLQSGELLAAATRRAAALQQVQKEYQQILGVRKRLSVFRGKLQIQQRDLANARKSWCQTLSYLGLDETVDPDAAVDHWNKVSAARDRRRKHLATRDQSQDIRLSYERFRKQVEDLGRRMQRPKVAEANPFEVVDAWDLELRTAREASQQRKRLKLQLMQFRKESGDWQRKLSALEENQNALLSLAGVSHRSQLDKRLELMERRKHVEALLEQSTKDLEHIVKSEPDVAIVEDELLRFNPNDVAGMARQYSRELEEIEVGLQQGFEQLGTIKQELKTLESDRSSTRICAELSQVETQLRDAWQVWFAASMARDAVDDVATQFEQANQPEMLAAAIPFLQKLTLGKYHHLWTPLGRKHLYVDDDAGDSRPAERLSGGTREQLFLAIRLAMVKAFSNNGIELPMVLDDVTVNFDQQRSEAAADTLIDFTREGQQLLVFTSHLHYAQLFQQRNVEPIWLPARHPSQVIEGVEERRAG